MVYVFTTARPKDPVLHLKVLETVKPVLTEMGIKIIAAYKSLEDENEQHVIFESPSAEVFTEFVMSPQTAEKMKEATLMEMPDIQYMLKIW